MSDADDVQIVKDKKGKPAFVVIPYARWQAMTAGNAEGAYLAKRYKAARGRDETEIPWDVAKRIASGENAVMVYRQ